MRACLEQIRRSGSSIVQSVGASESVGKTPLTGRRPVTGMQQAMPVVGGAVELLDFIPDNNIIGGYGQRYLLAERAGTTLAQSEHVRFLQDQTVFKGTARYDGTPAIAESFVLIGIGGTTPATSVTFAEDKANVTV